MKRVIALGFFDGVHLGHQALLRRAVSAAKTLGAIPAACTFDVHPATVISCEQVPLLTTPAQRSVLMKELGIEEVIIAPFDEDMMTMPWDRFVREYLVGQHNACHLVAGQDYRFGYRGEGTAGRLQALCGKLGIGCEILPKVEVDGITVSSTYIRELVATGELERAECFLGHPLW